MTSSLVTSSMVTLLMSGMLTLFLYHVILGRGEPVAEQLTRIVSSILDTSTEGGGFEENEGGSECKNV